MQYTCSECGATCEVANDEIKRECEHDDATVIAHCQANCVGVGSVDQ